MGRKISWCSGCYDEIELVYNKVIQNPAAASLLSEFEKRAFQEAEENCMMINRGNVPITREVFLAMSEADKERVMYILADIGLNEFNPSMSSPVISVTANSHFLRTAGPYFPDSPGHIKRTAWDISRAEGTPPY